MSFERAEVRKADGRRVWFYTWNGRAPEVIEGAPSPALVSDGLELRWHPLLEEWLVVAPERQERTHLPPPSSCPLCPTRDASSPTEVPARDYGIAVFENRFPSFQRDAPPAARAPSLYRSGRARGASEVVLYSPDHDATLASMPVEHIARLIDVWADRYAALGARREVEYVFIFENRGREIGVTLTHPHGQVYAFPFIPPRVERELSAAARYRRARGRCLHCDIVRAEARDGRRVVAQNDAFVSFVPYFARLPYELHIAPRAHRASLLDLDAPDRRDLAQQLKTVLSAYDALWDRPLPFMMLIHQRPTDGRRHPGCHLHIEFVPPNRSRDKLKYLAGCETGAGTFIVDARAEDTAAELRRAAQ